MDPGDRAFVLLSSGGYCAYCIPCVSLKDYSCGLLNLAFSEHYKVGQH